MRKALLFVPKESKGICRYTSSHDESKSMVAIALAQIGLVNLARRTWRILARALRNEVAHVRHQNFATEPRDQRFLAILTATRWRTDHSAPSLALLRVAQCVAFPDRASHTGHTDGVQLDLLAVHAS
jgi:hypothetical protein